MGNPMMMIHSLMSFDLQLWIWEQFARRTRRKTKFEAVRNSSLVGMNNGLTQVVTKSRNNRWLRLFIKCTTIRRQLSRPRVLYTFVCLRLHCNRFADVLFLFSLLCALFVQLCFRISYQHFQKFLLLRKLLLLNISIKTRNLGFVYSLHHNHLLVLIFKSSAAKCKVFFGSKRRGFD